MRQWDAGANNGYAFQAVGWPWLSGSAVGIGAEVALTFPSIAREITIVKNDALGELRVHYDSITNANVIANKHYMPLTNDGASFTARGKVKTIYLSGDGVTATSFTAYAELSGVDRVYPLSGSGINS